MGWVFDSKSNKMVFSRQTYENDRMTDEQRTAITLTDIANTLNEHIQFTWDSPETNSDSKLPVLDLKLWMDRDKEGIQYVQFTFYKKDVASKYTILKRSALSNKTKKSTHYIIVNIALNLYKMVVKILSVCLNPNTNEKILSM